MNIWDAPKASCEENLCYQVISEDLFDNCNNQKQQNYISSFMIFVKNSFSMSFYTRKTFIKFQKIKEDSNAKNKGIAQTADAIMCIANPFEQLKKSPRLPLKKRHAKRKDAFYIQINNLYNNVCHLPTGRRTENGCTITGTRHKFSSLISFVDFREENATHGWLG
ncbi:MAG: hypothetical protein KME46_10220 [Brasilonema angustatum HA4187-MV1]|nr:hypothetical protein [Brasilonema angustatum HA4187-MV1]